MDSFIVFWFRAYLIAFLVIIIISIAVGKPLDDAAFRRAGAYGAIIACLATGILTFIH